MFPKSCCVLLLLLPTEAVLSRGQLGNALQRTEIHENPSSKESFDMETELLDDVSEQRSFDRSLSGKLHLHVPHAHVPVSLPHIHIPVPNPEELIAKALAEATKQATRTYDIAKAGVYEKATNQFNSMTSKFQKYSDRVPFVEELITIAQSSIDQATNLLNGAGKILEDNLNITDLHSTLFKDGLTCENYQSFTVPSGIKFESFPAPPKLKTSKIGYCKRVVTGESFKNLPENLVSSFRNVADATINLFQGSPLLAEKGKSSSGTDNKPPSKLGYESSSCSGDFGVIFTVELKFRGTYYTFAGEAGIAVGCQNGLVKVALVGGLGPSISTASIATLTIVNVQYLFKWEYVDILHFEFKRSGEFGTKTAKFSLTTNFPTGFPFEFNVKFDKLCTPAVNVCIPVPLPGVSDQCAGFPPFCVYYPSDIPFSSNNWYATGFKASYGRVNAYIPQNRWDMVPVAFSKKYILADLSGSGPSPPITQMPTPAAPTIAPTLPPFSWDSFVNVAARPNGGVAFASSSLMCSKTGPGIGEYNLTGLHCYSNINDGILGNDNSWIPSSDKKYPPSPASDSATFVGIRFSGIKYIVGMRTSRDATGEYNDRSNDTFAVYATLASNPSYNTPTAEWFRIAVFQRDTNGFKYIQFHNGPIAASGIKIVQNSDESCTDELVVYGEAKDPTYLNVASRENGGVAFGSSSYLCSNISAGVGEYAMRSGIHCYTNINDGNFGNPYSWIPHPNHPHIGTHFVGIRFNGEKKLRGLITSRDATGEYQDRFQDLFTVYATTAMNASYDTSASQWFQIAQFTRQISGITMVPFVGAPITARGIKVVQALKESCTDEINVFADNTAPVINVALASNGGVAFASSSMAALCSSTGPGIAGSHTGVHCYNNVNDGKYGNMFSWIPGNLYNGEYFVGIRFSGPKQLVGFSTSRDGTGIYQDRGSGNFTVFATNVSLPSFDTPGADWNQIGVYSRSGSGLNRFDFPNGPVSATGVKVVQTVQDLATDELEIWATI